MHAWCTESALPTSWVVAARHHAAALSRLTIVVESALLLQIGLSRAPCVLSAVACAVACEVAARA